MALENCPMCSGSLENVEVTKTCGSCGADLSRWIPATPAPPPLPVAQDVPMAGTVSRSDGQFNLGLGITGAVGGAIAGVVAMYGFTVVTGIRFPLLGVGTGLLTGFAARWLYKGTDQTLGIISAIAAMLGVFGALVLIYGIDFDLINIISIGVSASVAYKMVAR